MSTSYDKNTWEVLHQVEERMGEQEQARIFRYSPEIKAIQDLAHYLSPRELQKLKQTNRDIYQEVMRKLQSALELLEMSESGKTSKPNR